MKLANMVLFKPTEMQKKQTVLTVKNRVENGFGPSNITCFLLRRECLLTVTFPQVSKKYCRDICHELKTELKTAQFSINVLRVGLVNNLTFFNLANSF